VPRCCQMAPTTSRFLLTPLATGNATHASYRSSQSPPVFHPEFGRFMLEATPGKPWGIEFKELLEVEPNMKLRFDCPSATMLSSPLLTCTM
jgi:hypothetical protein